LKKFSSRSRIKKAFEQPEEERFSSKVLGQMNVDFVEGIKGLYRIPHIVIVAIEAADIII
jgi:hypothetical protein